VSVIGRPRLTQELLGVLGRNAGSEELVHLRGVQRGLADGVRGLGADGARAAPAPPSTSGARGGAGARGAGRSAVGAEGSARASWPQPWRKISPPRSQSVSSGFRWGATRTAWRCSGRLLMLWAWRTPTSSRSPRRGIGAAGGSPESGRLSCSMTVCGRRGAGLSSTFRGGSSSSRAAPASYRPPRLPRLGPTCFGTV
jgi:hypothetical protein